MPRQPRIDIPDTVYHVFTRGHNKSSLFLDDEDRSIFLKHLKRAQERCSWDCLGYSLMTNHYHLQVKTRNLLLGQTMHYLNTLYAGHFNFRYKKTGHVFQNRFHSIPVQVDRYLLVLSRYIHLNAVAAGIVARPEDHIWSSYREYLGRTHTGLIRPELVLETLCDNPVLRSRRYQEFIEDGIHKKQEFTETTIWKTRVFGDDSFLKSIIARSPTSFAPRSDYQPHKNAI